MNLRLTYDQALADLTAIVAELGPDHVYKPVPSLRWDGAVESLDCAYFEPHTGAPSCGVGRVLARHGVTVSDVYEDHNVDTPLSTLLEDMPEVDVEPHAFRLLSEFQRLQDNGTRYGEALAEAITEAVS